MGKRRQKLPINREADQVCREYLIYFKQSRQSGPTQIGSIRRVIEAFAGYLETSQIQWTDITIEHVDGFLAAFNAPYARSTQRLHRSLLRCFLRYLYNESGLLTRNLADLVIGPPMYAKAKPPKFLRPHELRQLFKQLPYSTSCELRSYAMVHLAYFLGLRPVEISQITLDDISFAKAELIIRNRKNNHPLHLPIPDSTLKAITAYIVGARPQSPYRSLFLILRPPYTAMGANLVGQYLTWALRDAGLSGTAYWLRHTFAQNMLESGARIFEIKEMLGHDSIESTRNYLRIHTALMRKVIFDETV